MIDQANSNILAVIPARGGSKGIPHKNIYPLMGKPLIQYAIEALYGCNTPLTVAVSTDSDEIIRVCQGISEDVICIKRPEDISGDFATTETALLHALEHMRCEYSSSYEFVMTAQPTSPFRSSKTVDDFIEAYMNKRPEFDAMLTLNADYTDFWTQHEDGRFTRLDPNAPRRRQERKPLYIENSCLYLTTTESLKKTNSVLGSKCDGYLIDAVEAIDINTMQDIYLAQSVFIQKEQEK